MQFPYHLHLQTWSGKPFFKINSRSIVSVFSVTSFFAHVVQYSTSTWKDHVFVELLWAMDARIYTDIIFDIPRYTTDFQYVTTMMGCSEVFHQNIL